MQELRLVSATDDGAKLLLRSGDGSDFTLVVDERLRAAVRGDRVRMGQLEIAMDLSLRPRDIQARIRAGESAEQVAEPRRSRSTGFAGTKVRCLPSASTWPRWRAVPRSRPGPRRRPGPLRWPGPLLGDLVAQRLRDPGTTPTHYLGLLARDDGRWQVQINYRLGDTTAKADSCSTRPGVGRRRRRQRAAAAGRAACEDRGGGRRTGTAPSRTRWTKQPIRPEPAEPAPRPPRAARSRPAGPKPAAAPSRPGRRTTAAGRRSAADRRPVDGRADPLGADPAPPAGRASHVPPGRARPAGPASPRRQRPAPPPTSPPGTG